MNDRSALLSLAMRRGGSTGGAEVPSGPAGEPVGTPVLAGAGVIAVAGVALSLITLGIYYASDAARRNPYY